MTHRGFSQNYPSWDGADSGLIADPSSEYDYVYGDDASLSYQLPQTWPSFTFYGQAYSQITVDTNGNIWFGPASSTNSFTLSTTGPVISAWNNDLTSYFNGGVFVQHKTDLPQGERVVIEWQAESYTDQGFALPNNFEVVLFRNGDIRIDYKSFSAANAQDSGSGISSNDASHHNLSITSAYFPVYQLAGNSYGFTTSISTLQVNFIGTGGGIVTSSPEGIACNTNCSSTFPTGELVSLSPAPDQYSLFNGWTLSNGVCAGTNCQVTLDSDTTATATFDIDTTKQINVSGTFYTSLQEAYNHALTGDVINIWGITLNEGVTASRAIDVTLQGGYDSTYLNVVGTTKLMNPLIIQLGSVRVKDLAIIGSDSPAPAAPMMMSTEATTAAAVPNMPLTSGPVVILNKNQDSKKHGHDKDKDDDRDKRDKHRDSHNDD